MVHSLNMNALPFCHMLITTLVTADKKTVGGGVGWADLRESRALKMGHYGKVLQVLY